MTTKTDLSPLPSGNVARLITAQAAEIAALRAEVERVTCELMDAIARADKMEAEVKRLQEIVRPKREDECLTLDHWRMRAYALEENWSRCSRACAVEQTKREQAEARADKLAEALQLAEEHIGALTPEWYSAGRRVLAEIRAALGKENSND